MPEINVQAAYGPYVESTVIIFILMGILTVQVDYYYKHYKDDSVWVKSWVGVVFVNQIVHRIVAAYLDWFALVNGWKQPDVRLPMHWTPVALLCMEATSATLTQLYFVRRQFLTVRTGMRWMALATLAVSLFSLVVALVAAYEISNNTWLIEAHSFWYYPAWYVSGFVTDIMVTVPVVISLRKSQTGFTRTDNLLNRLALWVLASGGLTAFLALLALIFFKVQTTSLAFVNIIRILPGVYSSSLLAFLNMRNKWSAHLDSHSGIQWTSALGEVDSYSLSPVTPVFADKGKMPMPIPISFSSNMIPRTADSEKSWTVAASPLSPAPARSHSIQMVSSTSSSGADTLQQHQHLEHHSNRHPIPSISVRTPDTQRSTSKSSGLVLSSPEHSFASTSTNVESPPNVSDIELPR